MMSAQSKNARKDWTDSKLYILLTDTIRQSAHTATFIWSIRAGLHKSTVSNRQRLEILSESTRQKYQFDYYS